MKVLKGLVIKPLRFIRVRKALRYIPKKARVLDVGCGDGYLLMKIRDRIEFGIGVDERVRSQKTGNIEIKKISVKDKLPFQDSFFDVATMTAFIEHVDEPDKILKDMNRVLKKNGLCIITTPTRKARPIWEFLVRVGLSDEEADEEGVHAHKRYFTPNDLKSLLEKANFRQIFSSEFEFGMNYIAVGKKIG